MKMLFVILFLSATVVTVDARVFYREQCSADAYWTNSFSCGYGSFLRDAYRIIFGFD